MGTTIDYNNFITLSENIVNNPTQPYEYSSISQGVGNVLKNDPIIQFINLPPDIIINNGPSSTAPFDTVYIDLEQTNDWILMSGTSGQWQSSNQYFCAYTSGGFWALRSLELGLDSILCTGSGNANTPITDIQFETVNLLTTTFSISDATNDPIYLEPYRIYYFEDGSDSFPNVVFNQPANGVNFAATRIIINDPESSVLHISGFNYDQSEVANFEISGGSNGTVIGYSGNSQFQVNGLFDNVYLVEPFSNSVFTEGYSWNGTFPNEIMSDYTIINDNSNGQGTGVIQINNPEEFNNLILPLRKLYINFARQL